MATSSWPVAQCEVEAALAWQAATVLLGHPRPFFACVAAVACLGVRAAQRRRRVAELAVGVPRPGPVPGRRRRASRRPAARGCTRASTATRDRRVLVRRVVFALQTGDALPPALPDLLDRLADVLVLPAEGDASADAALHPLARELDPAALHADTPSGQVVVAQPRSAVVDLLVAAGEDVPSARAALPHL